MHGWCPRSLSPAGGSVVNDHVVSWPMATPRPWDATFAGGRPCTRSAPYFALRERGVDAIEKVHGGGTMSSRLNPYVSFGGDARQAMEFYQRVFGGELKMSTFGEYGQKGTPHA